jgi:ABC-2 type transport system permease protein
MSALIRAELAKLASVRSTYVAVAGVLALAAILSIAILTPAHARLDDIASLIVYPAFLTALIGTHNLAAEYERHTIADLYAIAPRRGRVIAAKAAASAIFGFAVGLLAAAVMLVAAALWRRHAGDTWTWSTGDVARTVLGMCVVTATYTVAGVAFAAIFRISAAATTALGTVYLGLSGLLANINGFGAWTKYGIGGAQLAAAQPTTAHALGFGPALGLNAGYCLVFLIAGITVVRRADV